MKPSSKKQAKKWTQRKWLTVASYLHIFYAVIYFAGFHSLPLTVFEALAAFIASKAMSKRGLKYLLYTSGYTVAISLFGFKGMSSCFDVINQIELGQFMQLFIFFLINFFKVFTVVNIWEEGMIVQKCKKHYQKFRKTFSEWSTTRIFYFLTEK